MGLPHDGGQRGGVVSDGLARRPRWARGSGVAGGAVRPRVSGWSSRPRRPRQAWCPWAAVATGASCNPSTRIRPSTPSIGNWRRNFPASASAVITSLSWLAILARRSWWSRQALLAVESLCRKEGDGVRNGQRGRTTALKSVRSARLTGVPGRPCRPIRPRWPLAPFGPSSPRSPLPPSGPGAPGLPLGP